MIVLDASLMIAWLLNEPARVPAPEIDELLERETLVVPAHWTAEIGNALVVNVRHGRLPADRLHAMIEDCHALSLELEPELPMSSLGAISELALAFRLALSDAVYVQIAFERSIPLATLDNEMRAAARHLGVSLIPA